MKSKKIILPIITLIFLCAGEKVLFSAGNDAVAETEKSSSNINGLKILAVGCRFGYLGLAPDECAVGFVGLIDTNKNKFIWKKYTRLQVDSATIEPRQKLSASWENTLIIRNIRNGKKVASAKPGYCRSFSPDGKYLVVGGSQTTIGIYETKNYRLIRQIRLVEHEMAHWTKGIVNSISFASQMDLMAVSLDYGTYIISMNNFEVVYSIKRDPSKTIGLQSLFSPDGKYLVVEFKELGGEYHYFTTVFEVPTFEMVREIPDSNVSDMQFSPDGNLFATSGEERPIRIWDFKTGKLISTIGSGRPTQNYDCETGKWSTVIVSKTYSSITFSKDGEFLSALSGSKICIWTIDGRLVYEFQKKGYDFYHAYLYED